MDNGVSMMPPVVPCPSDVGEGGGEASSSMMPKRIEVDRSLKQLPRRSQTLSFGEMPYLEDPPSWVINAMEAEKAMLHAGRDEQVDAMRARKSSRTPRDAGNGYVTSSFPLCEEPDQLDLKRTHTAPASLAPRQTRGRQDVVCPNMLDMEGASVSWPSRRSADRIMREEERCLVREQVKHHPVCALLNARDIDTLVDTMEYFVFRAGERLANQGDVNQHFGVVHKGRLDVYLEDGRVVCVMEPGKAFGGSALLLDNVKRVTIVAKEDCGVWGIDGQSFREVLATDAQKRTAEMVSFLDSIRLLDGLNAEQKNRVSEVAMYTAVHEAGDQVIAEGVRHTAMCIVKSGTLSVLAGGDCVRQLEVGDHFGKSAAFFDRTKSKCSIVADTRCELVCMSIESMKTVLGQDVARALDNSLLMKTMEDSQYLSQFSMAQRRHFLDSMQIIDRRPSELIADRIEFIIVLEGQVCRGSEARRIAELLKAEQETEESPDADKSDEKEEVFLERGQLAETASLIKQRDTMPKRKSSRGLRASHSRIIYTDEDLRGLTAGPEGARCAILSHEGLSKSLEELGIEAGTEESVELAKRALLARKIPIFHHLTSEQIDSIAQSFIRVRLEKGATVFEAGMWAADFWVIAKGEVEELDKDGKVARRIGRNGHLGHAALLLEDNKRSCTVRVVSEVAELWQLERETFDQHVTGHVRAELVRCLQLQTTPVELEDLQSLRVIGNGSFGSVRLVQHKKCGTDSVKKDGDKDHGAATLRYALKRVQKRGGKVDELLQAECALLSEMDHPLILQLVRTYDTRKYVYILTELLTGGELLAALDHIGRPLLHGEAQFYAGSLVLVLDFLRDRNVVFRDLKPENVMLDGQGYIKLIDFGTAKKLSDDGHGRAFTIIGSYHFMAPEVSKGRGYGTEVDIWSLGIMIYEFVCGRLPFAPDLTDFIEIRQAVHTQNLVFPEMYADAQGKHLMRGMLRKEPERRLGTRSFEDIRYHEYFRLEGGSAQDGRLFDLLLGRRMLPPWQPPGECFTAEAGAQAQVSDAVIGRDW